MVNVTETPSVVKDIVETEQERTFWEVVRHHERPPFYDAKEGVGNRLNRAARLVYEERLTPNSDGSYTVEGSPGHTYRVREHCSCPDSTYRKERGPCYHEIAVVLYVEWHRRLRPPVELGTLRPGTLPLPPVTVDERLAQAASVAMDRVYDALPTPQEDRMTEDKAEYIPEPDIAPVAMLDASDADFPPMGQPGMRAQVKIPREFTVNIKGKVHVLYTGLVVAARANGLMTLSADWTYNDAELSLAHAVCTFADGRRYEESGDASPSNVTKGISLHFRRVALTRAKARCLRDALGISECSVEELGEEHGKPPVPVMTPNPLHPVAELRQRIWSRVQALAPGVTTREAVEAFILAQTSYPLEPDNYRAILATLAEEQGP